MKYDTLYREHFGKSAAGGPDVKTHAGKDIELYCKAPG